MRVTYNSHSRQIDVSYRYVVYTITPQESYMYVIHTVIPVNMTREVKVSNLLIHTCEYHESYR